MECLGLQEKSKHLPSITENKIRRFCLEVLDRLSGGNIGFVDVGSGGDLKTPWKLLPSERLRTINFEPTHFNSGKPSLCISNRSRTAPFFVAQDKSASSLHQPLSDFVDRYGFEGMLTRETISVQCTSLDEQLAGCYESADALDINVEGHDFQVLQGADKLLSAGAIKLVKVEFELAPAYEGQGYFSDIDPFLRARDFRLGAIEIEHVRPATVKHLHHRGEPIWGKALYAPTQTQLRMRLALLRDAGAADAARRELASAIALYTASRLSGYAYDAITQARTVGIIDAADAAELITGLGDVFHWARYETGVSQLWSLVFSAIGGRRRKH